MTVDVERGIVYVPTGSAAFDFYGADRVGDDLFANCLIALNAETGERIWHFQGVHHDLWDRDFPSPPVLLTVERNGKKVDAVAQTTKQGFVYLFDRANGNAAISPRLSELSGQQCSGRSRPRQQQCLPSKPAPFARQLLTDNILSERTPEVHQWALESSEAFAVKGSSSLSALGKIRSSFPASMAARSGAVRPSIPRPAFFMSMPTTWLGRARWRKTAKPTLPKRFTRANAPFATEISGGIAAGDSSLIGVGDSLRRSVAATIENGEGRCPFPIPMTPFDALVDYVMSGGWNGRTRSWRAEFPSRSSEVSLYRVPEVSRSRRYPAVAPPWGTLNAINLNTGELPGRFRWGVSGAGGEGLEKYGHRKLWRPDRHRGRLVLLERQTSTRNSAPSTSRRASFSGKRRCHSPGMPRPSRTKSMDASSWSSPPAAGRIGNLYPGEFMLLSR